MSQVSVRCLRSKFTPETVYKYARVPLNGIIFQISMEPVQLKFKACSTIMVAGPTGVGKTVWTHQLLKEDLFTEVPASILYCYGVYQPFYDTFTIPNLTFHQGVPSSEKLQKIQDGKFHIIVLDDLMEQINNKGQEVEDMFTKLCHHYNMTAIYLTQNIFGKGKHARTISLNTHYLILFENKRDESQCLHLGKQLYPHQVSFFLEVLHDAVAQPHGYLLVDCSPNSPKEFKLRTNVFSTQNCIVYLNKNQV